MHPEKAGRGRAGRDAASQDLAGPGRTWQDTGVDMIQTTRQDTTQRDRINVRFFLCANVGAVATATGAAGRSPGEAGPGGGISKPSPPGPVPNVSSGDIKRQECEDRLLIV